MAVLGAAFSANKGAAAMLVALIQNLPRRLGPCRFCVLTTFPTADAKEAKPGDVDIVDASPVKLVLMFLLAGLSRLLAPTGIDQRAFCLFPAMRRITEADVVVDMAGISFADGRGLPTLAYNIVMTSTPLLLGRPVVKVAQALGPFEEPLNRLAAKAVLPHLSTICARGARTEANLRELGLENVIRAADLAFTMQPSDEDRRRAEQLLGTHVDSILVLPSEVVHRYARRQGRDYVATMASFVDSIAGQGHKVVLLPHSVRVGEGPGRMNDVPVCKQIYEQVTNKGSCLLITDNLAPEVLRAVVASSSVVVTSRFHAMVSALATRTPVIVVGWSHKYQEVLDEFEITGCSLDHSQLERGLLIDRLDGVLARREELVETIGRNLPAVRASALLSLDAVARAVSPSR
ncbi:MAG: polysaccharide pyruvyl transferase family protein [Actinomycetota bacterium]